VTASAANGSPTSAIAVIEMSGSEGDSADLRVEGLLVTPSAHLAKLNVATHRDHAGVGS
jgi:hypothetical protein